MPAPHSSSRIEFDTPQPTKTEQLLARLLIRAFGAFPESHFKRPLVRAAREAVRMTECTGYAALLLPELFAELAIAAMLKAESLRFVRACSHSHNRNGNNSSSRRRH